MIEGPHEDLRLQIKRLFEEGKGTSDIVTSMNGHIRWPEHLSPTTRIYKMQKILKHVVGETLWNKKPKHVVKEVLTGFDRQLRIDIMHLYEVKKLTPKEIVAELGERIAWPPGTAPLTKEKKMREITLQLIDEKKREKIKNQRYADHLESVSGEAAQKRSEWMKKQGMRVWSDEEKEYFAELLRKKTMKCTPERYNHAKIADAMNKKFGTEDFTKEMSMNRLLAMRHGRDILRRRRERLRNGGSAEADTNGDLEYEQTPAVKTEEEKIEALRQFLGIDADVEGRANTEFAVESGETFHQAAARIIAGKIAILDADGAFGTTAALVLQKEYEKAMQLLAPLATEEAMANWKPIQLQLHAMVLLCADPKENGSLADRLLEFSARKLSDNDSGFSDAMTLPPSVNGVILSEAEPEIVGRYSASRPSRFAQ